MTISNLKHGDLMQQNAIDEILEKFQVSEEKLNKLMHGVGYEMKNGLKSNKPSNDLKMIPSFVVGHPTGNEKGTYLALEISGVDIYVCQVRLKGEGGKLAINQYQYKIPDHLTAGDSMSTLIDYLADCVADFQHRVGSTMEMVYAMGISMGFAVRQTGLDKGFIVALEHGFEYPNAIGSDIVDLFHQRFKAKGLAIKVVAMANGKLCIFGAMINMLLTCFFLSSIQTPYVLYWLTHINIHLPELELYTVQEPIVPIMTK